jgi:ATP-dependent RNA helicase RhlE
VHRIGRTARAGGSGSAVSLVSSDEAPLLRDIEKLLQRSLPVTTLPDYPVNAPSPAAAPPPSLPSGAGAPRRDVRRAPVGHAAAAHPHGRRPHRSHGSASPPSISRARRPV